MNGRTPAFANGLSIYHAIHTPIAWHTIVRTESPTIWATNFHWVKFLTNTRKESVALNSPYVHRTLDQFSSISSGCLITHSSPSWPILTAKSCISILHPRDPNIHRNNGSFSFMRTFARGTSQLLIVPIASSSDIAHNSCERVRARYTADRAISHIN